MPIDSPSWGNTSNPFGPQETDDPVYADARNFYKVERWSDDDQHIEALLYAGNRLEVARLRLEEAVMTHSARRYTIRQRARILGKWRKSRPVLILGLRSFSARRNESVVSDFRFLRHSMKYPRVICPGCKKPMKPGEPQPIAFAEELADIPYVCEICGTQTARTIKLDDWKDTK